MAVEAKCELVEVVIQMLIADRPLVGAQEPTFEQRSNPMRPRQQVLGISGLVSLYQAVMDIALQVSVGLQSIGLNRAARLEGLGDKPMQRGSAGVGDVAQPDATDPPTVGLGGHHNQGLVHGLTALHARFLPAPVRLVHLHETPQPVAPGTHHRSTQLVKHGPGRLVAAQPQRPLQAQRADTILLGLSIYPVCWRI